MTTARPRLAALGRWARAGGLALVLLYLGLVATACTFQRSLYYFPDPTEHPPPEGSPIQAITLKAPDGERLVGWWLPPQAGRPTLLFFGGNGDSLMARRRALRRERRRGRGHAGRGLRGLFRLGGHPSETAISGDAERRLRLARRRVATRDIVMEGYSLGTGVAVRLAVAHQPRALVLEAPYTSFADVALEKIPVLPAEKLLIWDRLLLRDAGSERFTRRC